MVGKRWRERDWQEDEMVGWGITTWVWASYGSLVDEKGKLLPVLQSWEFAKIRTWTEWFSEEFELLLLLFFSGGNRQNGLKIFKYGNLLNTGKSPWTESTGDVVNKFSKRVRAWLHFDFHHIWKGARSLRLGSRGRKALWALRLWNLLNDISDNETYIHAIW